jgi:hypothetical protein
LDLLVSRLPDLPGISVYDPFSHALRTIDLLRPEALSAYHREVETLFPDSQGCVLTLLVDQAKLDSKYLHWQTLALRDAGAVLATLGICAAGLGMGFCFGGILGNELLSSGAFSEGDRIPVGSAIYGAIGKTE